MLLGCILIRLASAPGHSFGIVAFIDSFIDELHADRLQISMAWLFASCVSTVLTPIAGWGVDTLGVRRFCTIIAPALLISVLALSGVHTTAQLAICLSCVRFLGPECLTLASGATYQRWFVRYRGRAAAIFGINGYVLMVMPAMMSALIESLGWQGAARALAVTLFALLTMGTAMVHDTPESVGLRPDGDPAHASDTYEMDGMDETEAADDARPGRASAIHETTTAATEEVAGTALPSAVAAADAPPFAAATLREACRQPSLWCLALVDTCFCLYWAGFNLTALDVVAASSDELSRLGASRVARDVFLPLSIFQNGVRSLISLFVIDRLSNRRRALATAASAAIVALVAMTSLTLRSEAGVVVWAVAYGVATGLYLAFMEVIHASLFGTVALGRIMGFQRAFGTFSTGMGPVFFAMSHAAFGGSYKPCIALVAVLLAVSALLVGLLSCATLRDMQHRERLP